MVFTLAVIPSETLAGGNPAVLENEIRNKRPVAVGWLHKGPVSKPQGGGHWTCVIGFDKDNFIHHDPYGDADMINGGYINTDYAAIGFWPTTYSRLVIDT